LARKPSVNGLLGLVQILMHQTLNAPFAIMHSTRKLLYIENKNLIL
jgi:hypothetical protein